MTSSRSALYAAICSSRDVSVALRFFPDAVVVLGVVFGRAFAARRLSWMMVVVSCAWVS